jgi:3-keto-L-gulonate-6-phosphate decarboxylase
MRIQYPLDFLSRDEALRMAAIVVEGGVTCVEAGHLLIKVCGASIVTDLRREFGGIEIVADMKTMDMGAEEVLVAADAGADEVIICAAAGEGAITAALGQAAASRVHLMCSLMGVRDRVGRTTDLKRLGVPEVIAHRGFDDTFTWTEPGPEADLRRLIDLGGIAVAVAGGMSPDALGRFAALDLSRIVIGRAITNAADPLAATRAVVAAVAASVSEHAGRSGRS